MAEETIQTSNTENIQQAAAQPDANAGVAAAETAIQNTDGPQAAAQSAKQDSTANAGDAQSNESSTEELLLTDIDFQGLVPDEKKGEVFEKYKHLFKGKNEINAYLKELKEADDSNKKQQSDKLQKMKSDWETELKSDESFGKDYEANKNKVLETLTKFGTEKDRAELEKLGVMNIPAFNRIMFNFAKEIEDGKAMRPNGAASGGVKRDAQGIALMDFSKSLS